MVDHIAGFVDDGLILQLITSENPSAEVVGRLLATGVVATIEKWARHEMRRGTEHILIEEASNVVGCAIAAMALPPVAVMDEAAIKFSVTKLTELTAQAMEMVLRERQKVMLERRQRK